jgi:hypothetical protein
LCLEDGQELLEKATTFSSGSFTFKNIILLSIPSYGVAVGFFVVDEV